MREKEREREFEVLHICNIKRYDTHFFNTIYINILLVQAKISVFNSIRRMYYGYEKDRISLNKYDQDYRYNNALPRENDLFLCKVNR